MFGSLGVNYALRVYSTVNLFTLVLKIEDSGSQFGVVTWNGYVY